MRPQADGWVGRIGAREVRSRNRASCLSALRRIAGDVELTVEVTPRLVGVSEAAEILGWDRRRVATYVSRGAFPEPVVVLASGRVWRREDIERFGADRARRPGRKIRR
jgi:predicted DNA-binding transcriptional regulator AlpA